MNEDLTVRVAIAIYAADGMKHAMPDISPEKSWAMSPQHHHRYLLLARAAIQACFNAGGAD